MALYAALALELNDVERRVVLPMGRRDDGLSAMEGDMASQVLGVENEAGVREQL